MVFKTFSAPMIVIFYCCYCVRNSKCLNTLASFYVTSYTATKGITSEEIICYIGPLSTQIDAVNDYYK
jgi:hypothetical protein